MELILWRHAEATDGAPDQERELTTKGHKQADRMAHFLRTRLPEDTRIFVSPARRTQQTALALTGHYITEAALGTSAGPQDVLDAIGWPDAGGTVLVVGHQPTLGQIAARLLAGTNAGFSVKKGAVWWLVQKAGASDTQASLKVAVTPDSL
jgi:phosphohistidine phosphatase